MTQTSLFDDDDAPVNNLTVSATEHYRRGLIRNIRHDWLPDSPPEIHDDEKRVILNCETTGLRWWDQDRPVGWSYCLPESGRFGYLPIRHEGGGNLPVERVHDFLRSLRGKHVENINTKFDLHMSRGDGVDLTEQDNTFGDAAHHAALLDDNRMRFNLDQLTADILGWDVTTADGLGKIDARLQTEKDFQFAPAGVVAPYAVRNVLQVARLIDHFTPQIKEQELERVLRLEQDIIPVVVELERNGTYIDTDLLHDWQKRARADREKLLEDIYLGTGVAMESPDSPKSLLRLFQARNIPVTSFTAPSPRFPTGQPSFTDGIMKVIPDEYIQKARRAGQLADLESKYLTKYANTVTSDGWLRFQLHQLRCTTDGSGEDRKGTVSGRFSAAGDREGGFNPQQVVAVEKQLERGWCSDYVVRKLFKLNFAADMMQVEYRIFSHYSNDPNILAVYAANPLADFHKVVMEMLHTINPRLNRKLVKNINFAKLYGAGLIKFAWMLGELTEAQFEEFAARLSSRDWSVLHEPALDAARKLNDDYGRMFPTVGPLLEAASATAKQRGYVFTLMGRRARLLGRYHSALNRIIQGGAADVNKLVLREVYKQRKRLGLTMRLTVHDELAGDLADKKMLTEVMAVLNHQYVDLLVQILWDGKVGANWAECK